MQIVLNRVRTPFRPLDLLLSPPRPLKPSFSLLVQCGRKFSGRLKRLLTLVAKLEPVEEVVLLWPSGRGPSPEVASFRTRQHVSVQVVEDTVGSFSPVTVRVSPPQDQRNFLTTSRAVKTDFVLTLDERLRVTGAQVQSLMEALEQRPERLVTWLGLSSTQVGAEPPRTAQDPATGLHQALPSATPSLGLLHLAGFSAALLTEFGRFSPSLRRAVRPLSHCEVVLFNALSADRTLNPPFAVGSLPLPGFVNLDHYSNCFNKLVRLGGYNNLSLPLLSPTA